MPHIDPLARAVYMREYARRYRAANRDKINAYHRAYRKAHPRKRRTIERRFRKRHQIRLRVYQRRWKAAWRKRVPGANAAAARRWYLKHPRKARAAQRRAQYLMRYGITTKQYETALVIQNGVCAICLKPPRAGKRLHVEHCHGSKRVRGLTCYRCNRIRIGPARDTDALLYDRIAAYLRSDYDMRLL